MTTWPTAPSFSCGRTTPSTGCPGTWRRSTSARCAPAASSSRSATPRSSSCWSESVTAGRTAAANMEPLGDAEELFMLAEFVDGREYADDLLRLKAGGAPEPRDVARADALCDYLVAIHRVRGPDPGLYVRRIRDLLGHGECLFGVADSF